MFATMMLVFALNSGVQITRLHSASVDECVHDALAAVITLQNIGATDIYVHCFNQ